MGNLHDGHESLFLLSNSLNNKKIVSLFINPLQFDDNDDYKCYPKSIDKDISILERNNIDCLFMPTKNEVMINIDQSYDINLPQYMSILCGKHRKGHFHGVFRIIKMLFEITKPSVAYFGKKDYQQLVMIKYIIKEFFNNKIQIVAGNTIRESNGLAMSSRNNKLSASQKNTASLAYKELIHLKNLIRGQTDYQVLLKRSIDKLTGMGIKVEYLELLSSIDFSKIDKSHISSIMLFIAFYISDVRLIDNIEV